MREAIDKHEDCSVRLDSYTDQLNGLKNEKENLEAELERLMNENNELRQSVSDTQGLLDSVQEEKTQVVARLAEMSEQLEQRNSILQKTQAELDELENTSNNLLEQVLEAEKNNEELLAEKERMALLMQI